MSSGILVSARSWSSLVTRPTTNFGANAIIPFNQLIPADYADVAEPIIEAFGKPALTTKESDVAEGVWNAIHDTGDQLHFPAGPDAVALSHVR
jgi:hypothetical protein